MNKHAAFTMLHAPHDLTIPPEPGGGESHAARFSADQARMVEQIMGFFRSIGTGPRTWSEIQRLSIALFCRQLLDEGYLDKADPKQLALIRARVIEHEERMRVNHEEQVLATWGDILYHLEERITTLLSRGRISQAGRHIVRTFQSLAEFKQADPDMGEEVERYVMQSKVVSQFVTIHGGTFGIAIAPGQSHTSQPGLPI